MLWWQKIRLVREPKMDVHPLGLSDAHLFVRRKNEEIVNKVFNLLDDPTLFYHKVFSILGEFGSGKTTIVNYVRYSFFAKNISQRNLNITWKAKVENISGASTIRTWFLEELKKELINESYNALVNLGQVEKQQIEETLKKLKDPSTDETEIKYAFETLCKYYPGFIIFIDELHRLKEYQHVLDFLKSEQWLFQELCKQPVAIFIAGTPEWEKHLPLPEYSGIFDEVVNLPKWDSRNAYLLIDTRLRDAASDPSNYQNPFARDALDRVPNTAASATPRDWIRCAKKILEYVPDDTEIINAPLVAKTLHIVEDLKIKEIQDLLKTEFPIADRLLESIQNAYPSKAGDLMSVVAYLYHESIPIGLVDFDQKKVGVKDLSILLNILEGLGITVIGKQSHPPFKVKRKNVEFLELFAKVFQLDKHVLEFFTEVEEKMSVVPGDYVLSLSRKEENIGDILPSMQTDNVKHLKESQERAVTIRAKDHISRAVIFYEKFAASIYSDSGIIQSNLRYVDMTVFNIVAAYAVENSMENEYKVDFEKDLKEMLKGLNISSDIEPTLLGWHRENMALDTEAKQISQETDNELRLKAPEILDQLISQFNKWSLLPFVPKENINNTRIIDPWSRKISPEVLKSNAIHFLAMVSKDMGAIGIDQKWLNNFFEFVQKYDVETHIARAIDIRCHSQNYGIDKNASYSLALKSLGCAFTNVLVSIGLNYKSTKIEKLFDVGAMPIEEMLSRLFREEDWEIAEQIVTYPKTQPVDEFEKDALRLLTGDKTERSRFIRFIELSVMICNHYSGDKSEDTKLNTEEALFCKIVNVVLFSIISIFRHFGDRKKIVGFRNYTIQLSIG